MSNDKKLFHSEDILKSQISHMLFPRSTNEYWNQGHIMCMEITICVILICCLGSICTWPWVLPCFWGTGVQCCIMPIFNPHYISYYITLNSCNAQLRTDQLLNKFNEGELRYKWRKCIQNTCNSMYCTFNDIEIISWAWFYEANSKWRVWVKEVRLGFIWSWNPSMMT